MAITLKTRRQLITPRLDSIKDDNLAKILNDFAKIISEMNRNNFDDLTAVSTTSVVDSIYFGSPTANGTWRIILSGNNLSIQRRESGIWVEKDSITP